MKEIYRMRNSQNGENHQILLIDPRAETTKNTRFLLELAGYEVTTARGLDEAINLVSTFWPDGDYPAVIIIDNLNDTSSRSGLVDLLANRCRNSRIRIVNRNERAETPGKSAYRFVAPRHILGEIRKAISEQTLNSESSNSTVPTHGGRLT